MKFITGIILLIVSLNSLSASMQSSKKKSCSSSVTKRHIPSIARHQQLQQKSTISESQIIELGILMVALGQANLGYYKICTQEPQVQCKNCKKEMGYSCFNGGLVGKSFLALSGDEKNFAAILELLRETIKTVSEGSNSEIADLILKISNELQFDCFGCKSSDWESKRLIDLEVCCII